MDIVIKADNRAQVLTAVREGVRRGLEACGQQAVNYATLQLYPGHGFETGRLWGSITHQMVDDHTVQIGTNVSYAPYVELGHRMPNGGYVSPIPFIRPAVADHVEKYKQIIQAMLQNA